MVTECMSILAIILVMSYLYTRSGKPHFSLAILPLTLVPALHIIALPASRLLVARGVMHTRAFAVLAFDILAMVVSCLLFGGISRSIDRSTYRKAYCVLCGGFTVILACVLIYNTFIELPI